MTILRSLIIHGELGLEPKKSLQAGSNVMLIALPKEEEKKSKKRIRIYDVTNKTIPENIELMPIIFTQHPPFYSGSKLKCTQPVSLRS